MHICANIYKYIYIYIYIYMYIYTYMYNICTEPMALTGYTNICIIYKEFPNRLGIYMFGNPGPPLVAGVLTGCFISPTVKNQCRLGNIPETNGCP